MDRFITVILILFYKKDCHPNQIDLKHIVFVMIIFMKLSGVQVLQTKGNATILNLFFVLVLFYRIHFNYILITHSI